MTGTAMEMMTMIAIDSIIIKPRFRKDYGDIAALAESIARLGLLHPIVVSEQNDLICGERRVMAHRDLGLAEIEARIVDLDDDGVLMAEHDENETAKPFTVSERVAIGRAKEERLKTRWGSNQHAIKVEEDGGIEEVAHAPPPAKALKSREIAALVAGFGGTTTYREAKEAVTKGVPELVEALDAGVVSVRAASLIASLQPERQREIVAGGAQEMRKAATAVRTVKSSTASSNRMAKGRKTGPPKLRIVPPPEDPRLSRLLMWLHSGSRLLSEYEEEQAITAEGANLRHLQDCHDLLDRIAAVDEAGRAA